MGCERVTEEEKHITVGIKKRKEKKKNPDCAVATAAEVKERLLYCLIASLRLV